MDQKDTVLDVKREEAEYEELLESSMLQAAEEAAMVRQKSQKAASVYPAFRTLWFQMLFGLMLLNAAIYAYFALFPVKCISRHEANIELKRKLSSHYIEIAPFKGIMEGRRDYHASIAAAVKMLGKKLKGGRYKDIGGGGSYTDDDRRDQLLY